MLRNNYWSYTPAFGNRPKKFDFVHQTVSCHGVCADWAWDYRFHFLLTHPSTHHTHTRIQLHTQTHTCTHTYPARIYVCTSQVLTFPPNVNRSCVTITFQDNIAGREQRIGVVFTLLTGDAMVAQSMTTTIVADDDGEHCVSVWLGNTM